MHSALSASPTYTELEIFRFRLKRANLNKMQSLRRFNQVLGSRKVEGVLKVVVTGVDQVDRVSPIRPFKMKDDIARLIEPANRGGIDGNAQMVMPEVVGRCIGVGRIARIKAAP